MGWFFASEEEEKREEMIRLEAKEKEIRDALAGFQKKTVDEKLMILFLRLRELEEQQTVMKGHISSVDTKATFGLFT